MNEEVGKVSFSLFDLEKMTSGKPYSEFTAELIDSEVRKLVKKAYDDTMTLLKKHEEDIMKVRYN